MPSNDGYSLPWRDPSSFTDPVPVILNTPEDVEAGAAPYYIDPAVFDPGRAISSEAIYIPPENFGDATYIPDPEDAVAPAPVRQDYSSVGGPAYSVAPPVYNAPPPAIAYYAAPLSVAQVSPYPEEYHPYTDNSEDETMLPFGTMIRTSIQNDMKPVDESGNEIVDESVEIADDGTWPADIGGFHGDPDLSNRGNVNEPDILRTLYTMTGRATDAADEYLAENAPEHAARDNSWLYIAGGLALFLLLRK